MLDCLQLQRVVPKEVLAIILSYHPLFVIYTRIYQWIKYINGVYQERHGLNRDLFYSEYFGNPYYCNYEINIYRHNPFRPSQKKSFIIHQVDRLLESNCWIQ